jgi:predicted dehydrogenase
LVHGNPGHSRVCTLVQRQRAAAGGDALQAFKTITGPIFEFGFSDSVLQMWAAFLHELVHGKPLKKFAGCVTPEETALSHQLFTAALESQRRSTTVAIGEP